MVMGTWDFYRVPVLLRPPRPLADGRIAAFCRRSERFYGGMGAAGWSRLPWSSQTFKAAQDSEIPAALPAAIHSG
jgi:hypothetical protein